MARTRNLKPRFFTNEQLADLPPLTRILFAGLWGIADAQGRLEDRIRRIKTEVMPYDDWDIDRALGGLHDAGFITRYEVEGRKYIQVTEFEKHQRPHSKETPCGYPAPPERSPENSGQCPENSGTDPPLTLNPQPLTPTPLEASASCSEPEEPAAEPAVDGPSDFEFPVTGKGKRSWTLKRSNLAEYREAFPDLDIDDEFRRAKVWLSTNPRKRKTARGMLSFLTEWLGRSQNKGGGRTHAGGRPQADKGPTVTDEDLT